MPFGGRLHSSLALSSLSATVADIAPVYVRYFGLDFAAIVGPGPYDRIADGEPFSRALVGEWIFARDVFGDHVGSAASYAAAVTADEARTEVYRSEGSGRFDDALVAFMEAATAEVGPFLDRCCDEVLAHEPALVGLTSVFQQQLASLALARRIKDARPSVTVVIGGANCDGPMGRQLIDSFEYVDAAVLGEAEQVFPELVRRARAGRSLAGLRGVYERSRLAIGDPVPTEPIADLDDLPVPDQSDFFAQFEAVGLDGTPHVLFESSRGCWWGERRHCTFCGLNPETMGYRSKSPQRTLTELAATATAYPGVPIAAVDNILDRSYFDEVLPELAAWETDLDLFYEIKANLSRDQVRALRAAGIRSVQPGIESLSNGVLRLMQKGTTALQNVQLLKWCIEFGVHPTWNILWGFPGEDPAEYAAMAELVPLLTHLPPPLTAATVRLDRFSPLFAELQADPHGDLRPAASYPLLYDLSPEQVANLSYFFQTDPPAGIAEYTTPLQVAVESWVADHPRSALFFIDAGHELTIWDCRGEGVVPTRVSGARRDVYLALDRVCGLVTLGREHGAAAEREGGDLAQYLDEFVDAGLVATVDGALLALAVEVGDYRPPTWTLPFIAAALSGS